MIAICSDNSSPAGAGGPAALVDRPGPTAPPAPDTAPGHELGELLVKGPPDVATVAGWLRRFFVGAGDAVELRAIFKDGSAASGFYDHDHLDAMAESGLRMSQEGGTKGVYFTINPLTKEVLTRPGRTNEVRRARKGDTACAADIV